MILRRAILAFMVIVLALVAACEKIWGDGYTWYKRGKSAASWEWERIEPAAWAAACGDTNFIACAQYDFNGGHCRILSKMTLAEARVYKVNGRPLFDHEVGKMRDDGSLDPDGGYGHCAGYDHHEKYARGT